MTLQKKLILSILLASIIGGIIGLFSPGSFFLGWLASFLILSFSIYFLITIVLWAGGGRKLIWMVSLAFLLHLGLGITLHQVLPSFGFNEPQQKAGYVFYDSYRRDGEAWNLAKSGEPLLKSFQNEFATDQYGGLLSLSAIVYRYLSPDQHRPILIIILAAWAAALGIPFFYKTIRYRWGEPLASLATWILVFYPDGILYGSSQMREPFLVGLLCIAFWGVFAWRSQRKAAILALGLSFVCLGLVSSRVTAAAILAYGVLFWLENMQNKQSRMSWIEWIVIGLGVALVLGFSWEWLRSSSAWDLLLTERGSGWVAKVIGEAGAQWRIPFILVYGLVQPVLPAAIADPTLAVWKIIAVTRASGWYILAPLLLYGFISIIKIKEGKEKRIYFWIAIFLIMWIMISSLRAGGDQWDNPRYRSIFLPWMALIAAHGVCWAFDKRDFWLARMILVEMIFLGFFTNWYFSRYFLLWKRLPFWQNVVWVGGLTILILISGLIWDLSRWLVNRSKT